MIHFETIWNEAESVAKSFTNLSRRDILKRCRSSLDDLSDSDIPEEYHKALGELLFGLCSLCAHLEEKKNIQINSATALKDSIEINRAKILDNYD